MQDHPTWKKFSVNELFSIPEPLDAKIAKFQKLFDSRLPEKISIDGEDFKFRETGMGIDAYKAAR